MTEEKKEYIPPTCPVCGNPLTSVHEDVRFYHIFYPESGKYHIEGKSYLITVSCPFCDNSLDELFPEGACNYRGEQYEKESR